MQKNHDKSQVCIDVDVFEKLIGFAESHAKSFHFLPELVRIKRHVRKFNPKSNEVGKQIQKDKQDLELAQQNRKLLKRARQFLNARFDSEGNPRVFWYVRRNVMCAWPIHVHRIRKDTGMASVECECSFLNYKHKQEAIYQYSGIDIHSILPIKDICFLSEDIPEGFKIAETPGQKKIDLRTGNECCAHPVYANGECTQCGNLDPEDDSCCDNEDRNWNGGCNNCGDPCL